MGGGSASAVLHADSAFNTQKKTTRETGRAQVAHDTPRELDGVSVVVREVVRHPRGAAVQRRAAELFIRHDLTRGGFHERRACTSTSTSVSTLESTRPNISEPHSEPPEHERIP